MTDLILNATSRSISLFGDSTDDDDEDYSVASEVSKMGLNLKSRGSDYQKESQAVIFSPKSRHGKRSRSGHHFSNGHTETRDDDGHYQSKGTYYHRFKAEQAEKSTTYSSKYLSGDIPKSISISTPTTVPSIISISSLNNLLDGEDDHNHQKDENDAVADEGMASIHSDSGRRRVTIIEPVRTDSFVDEESDYSSYYYNQGSEMVGDDDDFETGTPVSFDEKEYEAFLLAESEPLEGGSSLEEMCCSPTPSFDEAYRDERVNRLGVGGDPKHRRGEARTTNSESREGLTEGQSPPPTKGILKNKLSVQDIIAMALKRKADEKMEDISEEGESEGGESEERESTQPEPSTNTTVIQTPVTKPKSSRRNPLKRVFQKLRKKRKGKSKPKQNHLESPQISFTSASSVEILNDLKGNLRQESRDDDLEEEISPLDTIEEANSSEGIRVPLPGLAGSDEPLTTIQPDRAGIDTSLAAATRSKDECSDEVAPPIGKVDSLIQMFEERAHENHSVGLKLLPNDVNAELQDKIESRRVYADGDSWWLAEIERWFGCGS